MAYWRLNSLQQQVLLDFVSGDTVYELGCGDLRLAKLMAQTAKHVHAADKERQDTDGLPENVTFHHSNFKDLDWPEYLDCVVVCWPVTEHMPGFMELVHRAFRVVYIGCNTDSAACGPHDLWLHLSKRMLFKEVRDEKNCLHCYSLVTHQDPQFRSEEEILGLLNATGKFRIFKFNGLLACDPPNVKLVTEQPVTPVGDITEDLCHTVIAGLRGFFPEERELCLKDIEHFSEGADRKHYEPLSDADLARAVLIAWKEFAVDKGAL